MKACFVILFLSLASLAPAQASEAIELVIDRSDHQLVVKKNGSTLRTYKVAFGSGGRKPKLQEGDYKTPLGTYYISRVRSSDRFHLFLQINYPSVDDAERALKTRLISKKEYRAIVDAHMKGRLPPQNTALGGSIGIHGIGKETKDKLEIHEIVDWTKGCIAMRNDEVEQLNRYIHLGTKVSIVN